MAQLFNILPLHEHQCAQCDKFFAQAKLLKQHERSHMAKTCECDEPGCAFKTAWPQSLKEHHRTQHTGRYHHFIWTVLNSKNSTFFIFRLASVQMSRDGADVQAQNRRDPLRAATLQGQEAPVQVSRSVLFTFRFFFSSNELFM
jgi:uncharacterized Zn-finger protein